MSREMTKSEAIANLNHIYGFLSPNIQRSLDVAFKALEERPQDCSNCKRFDFPFFEVKFDKEQMQELVDKAKAEVLASIERPQGEWIDHSDEGYVECPFCHEATNCEDNKEELHFCWNCGAEMKMFHVEHTTKGEK